MVLWSCNDCDNLDKNRKQVHESGYCYRYGCKARKTDGYICFWLREDSGLRTGGCSDFNHEVEEQLTLF